MARVFFTKPAEQDLLDIEYYIYVNLCNPDASRKVTDGILNTIEKTVKYPKGHSIVDDEVLSRIGLRMIRFDNYNIFYYFEEKSEGIYILRSLYNRVDWKNVFKFE